METRLYVYDDIFVQENKVHVRLHVRFIAYDFNQTCLLIYYRSEIYTITCSEYIRIGQTNLLITIAYVMSIGETSTTLASFSVAEIL